MSATSSAKLTPIPVWHKPKHHSYSTHLITMACDLMNVTGLGAGTCRKILNLISHLFDSDQAVPCRSTIATWNRKLATFSTHCVSPRPQAKWALLMDESITIGSNKVLLLLGVGLDDFKFNRPLRFEDCRVLNACLARSWTGQAVANQIDELRQSGFNIDYIVSDQGANLIKAAKLVELERVDDCAHYFSTLLRRQYLQLAEFELFEKSGTRLKRAGTNCNYAHLLPPKHHANSRFMNITPVIEWGLKTITLLNEHVTHELIEPYQDKINWVLAHQSLLTEMNCSVLLVDQLSGALKDEGYHQQTYRWAKRIIREAREVPLVIRQELMAYFHQLEALRGQRSHLICSTDIVESHFAHLKRKPIHCVGAASKRLVLCGRTTSYDQVAKAMEACSVRSLYRAAQLRGDPPTVAQKRAIINKLVA